MSSATLSPPAFCITAMHRFSIDEYERMINSGFFDDKERVELLDGWIVKKMPHNGPHDFVLAVLYPLLLALMPENFFVRCQSSVTFDTSIPEPDFSIADGTPADYLPNRPTANDIAVVIEVSDSSLVTDQDFKLLLYARNKIPIYWIVNFIDKRVEVYTLPRGGKNPIYRNRTDYTITDTVPVIVQGQTLGLLPVNEFIPQ